MLDGGASDWQMLWIGHPWVSWKHDGKYLHLSDYHEGAAAAELETRWRIPVDSMRSAVEQAERETD